MDKKIKKKNTLRNVLKNKTYTYDEVRQATRQIEETAIRRMSDACFFAHSIWLITLQDEFGFGPKRLARAIARFNGYCNDYAAGRFELEDPIEIGNELEAACSKLVDEIMRKQA